MLRLLFALITSFSNATWAAAETIDVKYYGKLDLAPFACTEVTRSSIINCACCDKTNQFTVVPQTLSIASTSRDLSNVSARTIHGAIS